MKDLLGFLEPPPPPTKTQRKVHARRIVLTDGMAMTTKELAQNPPNVHNIPRKTITRRARGPGPHSLESLLAPMGKPGTHPNNRPMFQEEGKVLKSATQLSYDPRNKYHLSRNTIRHRIVKQGLTDPELIFAPPLGHAP